MRILFIKNTDDMTDDNSGCDSRNLRDETRLACTRHVSTPDQIIKKMDSILILENILYLTRLNSRLRKCLFVLFFFIFFLTI